MAYDDKNMRVHEKFAKEMEEIQIERIKTGIDKKKLRPPKRLTLAIIRHSLWEKMKADIINHNLKIT